MKKNIPIIISLVIMILLATIILTKGLSNIAITDNFWKFFVGGISLILLFVLSFIFVFKLINSSK